MGLKTGALNLNLTARVRGWNGAALWRWWVDGLLAWLPAGVRRWLTGSSRRLIIMVGDSEIVLAREDAGQSQELGHLDRSLPDWDLVAKEFKKEKVQQLVLCFPANQALNRTLSLPLVAETNLRRVAGFEMDRLTPFIATQVYYDVSLLARQPEQRRLRAELTALPRAGVDAVLTALQQRGLSPDTLEVTGGRPGLNLLPPEQRVRRGFWEQRLRWAIIGLSLLLIAVAVVLPIWQQRLLVIGVMTKASQIQKAANQTLTLREQLDRILATSQILAQKKLTFPHRVDLLRELTTILPDDTWVERLQIRGDALQINGQSAKASALIGIIEASKLFNGAGFSSPVTTDPRSGKERFMLSARIGREP